MFGFKRRARERAQADLELTQSVYANMCNQLADIADEIMARTPDADERQVVVDKAFAIKRGIEAVFVDGLNPYGPELENEPTPTRGGAMLARAAHNVAMLTGTLKNPNLRADLAFHLGIPRDAA